MKTLPATFESDLRDGILNILYGQWSHLGAAFSTSPSADSPEIVDPEALIWGSLEFLPTEPRLAEVVLQWLHAHMSDTIRQRLKSRLRSHEPRTCIWSTIEANEQLAKQSEFSCVVPSEPCHGLNSPEQVVAFCQRMTHQSRRDPSQGIRRVGNPTWSPATLLLRLRYLMGSDPRHFLLLYLLCNPHGAPIPPLQQWTGYSQRTVSDTVARWADARFVSVEHGVCRLIEPDCWRGLLQQRTRGVFLVDWFKAFDACIGLLRALAKARHVGLSPDSSVISAYLSDAYHALSASSLSEARPDVPSLAPLRALLPKSGQQTAVA